MKKYYHILILSLLFGACGTNKNLVATDSKTATVITEETSTSEDIQNEPKIAVVSEAVPSKADTIIDQLPMVVEVFNHSGWNQLLKKHVSKDGRVNYEGFRNDKGILRDYIASLGDNMPTYNWSQEDKLAFWMNAYNAMTVDLIVRNLPLASIKDIDKPWDQRLWKLDTKWYNLDEIEHQILRKMGDARIHFGINCASFSCPPLLPTAFTSQNVDKQLDFLAKGFVNDARRNQISADNIEISKIFSWFAKDFKSDGSLIDFLNQYSETTINPKARKSFMDYDWTLNK